MHLERDTEQSSSWYPEEALCLSCLSCTHLYIRNWLLWTETSFYKFTKWQGSKSSLGALWPLLVLLRLNFLSLSAALWVFLFLYMKEMPFRYPAFPQLHFKPRRYFTSSKFYLLVIFLLSSKPVRQQHFYHHDLPQLAATETPLQ